MISKRFEELFNSRQLILALLLLVGALRFVNLGFGEIQEWDEALYAVRAKSIVQFGDWLDQTSHAVGGLYSGAHPPLFIWLTAIGYKLFGITDFTTRMWSAASGTGLIFVIYLLGKRLYSTATGFVAGILLGTIPLFTFYSRIGQLDVAYLFFMSLSFYFFIKYLDFTRARDLVFSGLAFGLSLGSKSLAGLLAPPLVLIIFLLHPGPTEVGKKKSWIALLAYAVIGLATVLPWYLFMEFQHQGDVPGGFFLSHVLGSVQSVAVGLGTNVKEIGYFYFLNQLVVRFPLGALGFASIIVLTSKSLRRSTTNSTNPLEWLAPIWFLFVFLFYSALRTKVVSYTLPMFLPLTLISANALIEVQSEGSDRRKSLASLAVIGIASLWSLSDEARVELKDLVRGMFSSTSHVALSSPLAQFLVLAGVLLILLVVSWRIEWLRLQVLKYIVPVVAVVSVGMLFFGVLVIRENDYLDGASELATRVNSVDYDEIIYLHTPHYTGGMNPQLAFYLDGVNCGWRKEKRFLEIGRSNLFLMSAFAAGVTGGKKVFIIIEKNEMDRPEKSDELKKVEVIVSPGSKKLLETKRYILYGNT